MGYLGVSCLLLFPFLRVTLASIQEDFLYCMAIHSTGHKNTTNNYIYTPSSPKFRSLLKSSQQNPRWSNSTSSKPLLIITPHSQTHIQTSILCTKSQGLQIRVLSGGHDYEGLSFLSKTPFLILDLISLRSININKEEKIAWVQSGATLGELYYQIAKKTSVLGFPAGLCPSVGVGGHFSGGGIGTMMRKYGLAADYILDATLIDGDGQILNREKMGDDLFWAIRGGGGSSFGVILEWKIKLVQVPPLVTVFTIDRKLEPNATGLVHRWQYIANKLEKDIFIRIIVQNVDGEQKKFVQASFNCLFLGIINDLIPLMKLGFPELGLRVSDCIEMSWIESVLYFSGYPRGQSLDVLLDRTVLYKSNFKAKSDFVKYPIPETALQGIWKRFQKEEIVFMIMDPFGGKMDEISESELPFPHRKGNLYNIQYLVKWEMNGMRESQRHLKWIRKLYKYMKPYVSNSPRAAYLNYRDLDLGKNNGGNTSYLEALVWGRKYFKGNFERLVIVKSKVDPVNFFRNEQSIPLLASPSFRI